MRIRNLDYANKAALTFLCVVFLNFKVECAENGCIDPDLLDTVKSNTRRSMPNILGFFSSSLSAAGFLKSANTQVGSIIGITGSSISLVGAVLNGYNWYMDRKNIKGFAHNALNGMVILSNLASVSLGFTAVSSDNQDEKNIYGVASIIVSASGMLFKGIDLLLTQSPKDEYKFKMACRLARQQTNTIDIELSK